MTVVLQAESPKRASTPNCPMVLHVRVVTGVGGGPDKTILNSPRHLADLGYTSICAYLRPPHDDGFNDLSQRAETTDASLAAVDDRGPFDWGVVRRLRSLCREHNVRIWHGHDYKSNFLGLLLRRRHSMALVTTVHGWGVRDTWRAALYRRIDKACLRRYDRVICVSDDLYEECRRVKVPEDRCVVIPNAIDVDEYTRTMSQTAARIKLGLPAERMLIGAVGRLSDEKGFDRLIRAVDRIVKTGTDVGLIIIGEGNQRGELEALISNLGLHDRVQLPGHRTDVIDLYQAMDVFALSSLREGLPNVVLEAMALETPVVATRIAGVPSLIEDGRTGRLVEPDNVDQLSAAITDLLKHPERRRQMANAARTVIEESYSFRNRMQKIARIYDELLDDQTES